MSQIALQGHALIERLERMDPHVPHVDRAVVEHTLTAHLAAFGLDERPFIWAENAQAGFHQVEQIIQPEAELAVATMAPRVGEAGQDEAVTVEIWENSLSELRDAISEGGRRLLWRQSRVGRAYGFGIPHRDAWTAACGAPMSGRPFPSAWNDVSGLVALIADRLIELTPHCADIAMAEAQLFELSSDDPASLFADPLADKKFPPVVEAFCAGLFLHWVLPQAAVCVPRPALSLLNDRLHSADGPAVRWPGEAYYFWHGVQVPGWLIEEPRWCGRI